MTTTISSNVLFELGRIAGVFAGEALRAHAAGELAWVTGVWGRTESGEVIERCIAVEDEDELRCDDVVFDDLVAGEGAVLTIDASLDIRFGQLTSRCIDVPSDRRMHWTVAFQALPDRIQISSLGELPGWPGLREGFLDGLSSEGIATEAFAWAPTYPSLGFLIPQEEP